MKQKEFLFIRILFGKDGPSGVPDHACIISRLLFPDAE